MKKNADKIFEPGKGKLGSIVEFGLFLFTRPGFELARKLVRRKLRKIGIIKEPTINYNSWVIARTEDYEIKNESETLSPTLKLQPRFSIVIPKTNASHGELSFTIESIKGQLYKKWEILLVVDDPQLHTGQKETNPDSADEHILHINLPPGNDMAMRCNAALAEATGDYVLFIYPCDILTRNCLFEFTWLINHLTEAAIIYADDDSMDPAWDYIDPYFKPAWSPDSLLSRNYIGNSFVIKRDLVMQLGGFRDGLNYSAFYDLLLRATEVTSNAGHIPAILFHKRSNKPVDGTQRKALQDAMIRRNTPADIEDVRDFAGCYDIKYKVLAFDKVSIIIPTKDQAAMLKTALDSILEKTDYPNYEIIVLNNNSVTEEFGTLNKEFTEKYQDKFRCIDAFFPFNFSKLINTGVKESKGKYILMLNNDIEVISNDWLTQMVSYAQHKHTGAVGAKLLYPDNTIQHAGIIFGANRDSGHVFAGLPNGSAGYFNNLVTATNYSAVTGACLMCRRDVYNEVGGMDENLAIEFNDHDFCLKLLKRGYYNVYLPTVELYHHESVSRGHPFRNRSAWKQHEKELAIFKAKWQSFIDNDPYYNPGIDLHNADFKIK